MKQFIKKFNNLVEKTIFKVQNKTNNNFKISNFNKYLITFISLLFVYLFYLLIPLLYEKDWVQVDIENKLLKEFKINLITSSEISYRILPAPHFLIKNSKILINDRGRKKLTAEIKDLKVFISQKNFFSKKKLNLKKVIINKANFSLLRNDFKLLNEFRNNEFSNKLIKINNSNFFFKDNLDEIISIVKIDEAILFFDNKRLLNVLNLSGEVFNIPFTLYSTKQIASIKNEIMDINVKNLRLSIFNESNKTNQNSISGKSTISLLNSKINTKYEIKNKLVTFTSDNSKINNSQISYNGKLSINPFDLDLNIDLNNYRISKVLNINPILGEFIKSGLLFNDNISLNTSLVVKSNANQEIFQDAKINLHIVNGKIDLNKTSLSNNDIGSLELNNSNLFFKDDKLIFGGDIFVDIKNTNRFFSFLNTNKSLRRDLKSIIINFEYNFSNNKIKFKNITIDNKDVSDQLLPIIENFNESSINNINIGRSLINELLSNYDG
tara:strand:+ start:702 stop:2186 length:1485 start_codon:yes stop_codon:yes gene_type:complete